MFFRVDFHYHCRVTPEREVFMKFSAIHHTSACLLMLGILACNRSSKVADTDTGSTTSMDDTPTAINSDSDMNGDTNADTFVDTATGNAADSASSTDNATESNSESPPDSDAESDTAIHPCPSPTIAIAEIDSNTYPLGMDDENLYFHEISSGKLLWTDKQTGERGELDMQLSPKRHRLAADVNYLYLYEITRPLDGDASGTVQVLSTAPDFQVQEPIVLNQSIGELQVENGTMFVTPRSLSGLVSYDLDTGGETVWTTETIESFYVSSEWVYWNSLKNNGRYTLVRQPRSGGERIAELASGPIFPLDYKTDRILLWTLGGAFGPPIYSSMIDESVEGFLFVVPNDQNGLDMPHVVPGFDTYFERFERDEDSPAAIVGDYVYFSNSKGELWRLPVDEALGDPTLLETRGSFDNDDYNSWMQTDATALYWLAGPTPGERASDDDPVSIFRTCINNSGTPDGAPNPLLTSMPGNTYRMTVTRLADHPGANTLSPPIDESLYSPVENGNEYTITVSAEWREVGVSGAALSDGPAAGTVMQNTPTSVLISLDSGLWAGGYLFISVVNEQLVGELVISGSGFPIISAEKGPLTPVE
jgi:hypothetical protein